MRCASGAFLADMRGELWCATRMLCMRVIASPMAGTVARVLVQVGNTVTSGQDVVILESMKMEIAIQADAGGMVRTVQVTEGEFVDEGTALIEIE